MEYLIIFMRIFTIMLLLLFTTLLIMGKRPIGELPVFDFLSLVVMGAIVGADIADPNIEHLPTAFAVVILALLQRVISELMVRNKKINKLLTFEPTIVVSNGKFIYKNIRKIKYTIEEVMMLLRDKDIFDVNQVKYALVEPNGKLSILKKENYLEVTKKDLNINPNQDNVPIVVIREKQVIKESLSYINLNENELYAILKSYGYQNYEDLFVVTMTKSREINISTYLVNENLKLL